MPLANRQPRLLGIPETTPRHLRFKLAILDSGWWWLEPWNFEWLSRNSWEWKIIPTDFHSIIFQRGWLKPPTRWSCEIMCFMSVIAYHWMSSKQYLIRFEQIPLTGLNQVRQETQLIHPHSEKLNPGFVTRAGPTLNDVKCSLIIFDHHLTTFSPIFNLGLMQL